MRTKRLKYGIAVLVVLSLMGWLVGCNKDVDEVVDAQGVKWGQYGSAAFHGSIIVDNDATITDDLTVTDDLTADTGTFATGATVTSGGLTVTAGGVTVTAGGLDMTNDAITNIGAAGTDFSATGGLTLADALTVTSGGATVTAGGLSIVAGVLKLGLANETITEGEVLVPAYTVYSLDTSGAVTMTLGITGAVEGQLLILINDDANAVIIADTNIMSSDGGAITLAGAEDCVVFIFQDTTWHELLLIADS